MIAWIHSVGWELYVFYCAVSLDRVTWYKQEVIYSVYSGGLTFTSYSCSLRNWWHAQLVVGKGISSFIVVLSRVFFFFISRVCVCVCVCMRLILLTACRVSYQVCWFSFLHQLDFKKGMKSSYSQCMMLEVHSGSVSLPSYTSRVGHCAARQHIS